jgi:hypothetical protein
MYQSPEKLANKLSDRPRRLGSLADNAHMIAITTYHWMSTNELKDREGTLRWMCTWSLDDLESKCG